MLRHFGKLLCLTAPWGVSAMYVGVSEAYNAVRDNFGNRNKSNNYDTDMDSLHVDADSGLRIGADGFLVRGPPLPAGVQGLRLPSAEQDAAADAEVKRKCVAYDHIQEKRDKPEEKRDEPEVWANLQWIANNLLLPFVQLCKLFFLWLFFRVSLSNLTVVLRAFGVKFCHDFREHGLCTAVANFFTESLTLLSRQFLVPAKFFLFRSYDMTRSLLPLHLGGDSKVFLEEEEDMDSDTGHPLPPKNVKMRLQFQSLLLVGLSHWVLQTYFFDFFGVTGGFGGVALALGVLLVILGGHWGIQRVEYPNVRARVMEGHPFYSASRTFSAWNARRERSVQQRSQRSTQQSLWSSPQEQRCAAAPAPPPCPYTPAETGE